MSLTLPGAREAVHLKFKTDWGTRTPYVFENEDYAEPSVSWVRVTVRSLGGGQETLGPVLGRKYRRSARVVVQIFTPVNQGKAESDGHVAAVVAIFEGKSFSGLDFNNSTWRESVSDGKWDVTIVDSFFDYEELK